VVQHIKIVCVSVGLLVALSSIGNVSSAIRHPAAAQSSVMSFAVLRAIFAGF
jgi:hypothetical protein